MGEMQKGKQGRHLLTKTKSLLSSNNQQPINLFTFIPFRLTKLDLVTIILIVTGFNLCPLLHAQIKIEERVEIEPESYNYETDDPILNHIIQLDVQWNQPQYDAAIAGVVVPCQGAGADWQNGGTISLIINNAMAGFYRLQPRFNTPSGVITHVTYQLYLDGAQVLSGQKDVPGGFSGGSYPYFNIEYTPPLASSFSLNLQNNTSCILIPTPVAISASNSCATGYSWYRNTEPLNLLFTSGGEYASFYTNGQKIGDSYSGTLSEIQGINVIQDKVYRGSEDMYYVVQGDWAGIIKTDSVRLISQIGDVIVADTGGDDSLYTGQQIQVELYPNNFGGQCSGIFFPYEVTYNVEIISGNQFGNLIDYFPYRRVQILTGLSHWYGMSAFNYIADGISSDSLETVTIRISTSDPEIPYTDLTLYIKPSPIYAYTVPEVLGADDSADVIIKKRNPDGTLEDFPAEQTFELAVLEGCVNGNFMVGDSINVYFADALQPIKFVTADSLDSEVDSVLIRVGTDLSGYSGYNRPVGGGSAEEEQMQAEYESKQIGATGKTLKELRAGFEKMIAEKKAQAEAEESGEPMFPVVNVCAPNNPTYSTYYSFLANVQDECDEWACDQNFKKYDGTIGIKDEAANYNNYNLCRYWNITEGVGGFFPLFDKKEWYLGNGQFTEIKDQLIAPYQMDACYNTNEDYWKFSVFEDSISLRAIIDVCESNIGYENIIHNLQELSIIPNENTCLALEDFEKQRKYAPLASVYYIYEMAWAHEKVHKNDFYNRIKEVLNYKFRYNNTTFTYKEWLTTAYQPKCNELDNTKSKAIYQAKKHYNKILKEFIIKLKNEWDKFTHKGDDFLHQKYEEETQADPIVQWKIRQYKLELQKRPGAYWENCEFKEEIE